MPPQDNSPIFTVDDLWKDFLGSINVDSALFVLLVIVVSLYLGFQVGKRRAHAS
jgi:hypothetical protein